MTQLDKYGQGQFQFNRQLAMDDLGEDFLFPKLEGHHLYVHALVRERATGHQVIVTDTSAKFVKSPYVINMDRLIKYFKPGLLYDAKVGCLCCCI